MTLVTTTILMVLGLTVLTLTQTIRSDWPRRARIAAAAIFAVFAGIASFPPSFNFLVFLQRSVGDLPLIYGEVLAISMIISLLLLLRLRASML